MAGSEAALVAVNPGEVCGGAQLKQSRFLIYRDRQRLFEEFLRIGQHAGSAFDDECARFLAEELRFKHSLAVLRGSPNPC